MTTILWNGPGYYTKVSVPEWPIIRYEYHKQDDACHYPHLIQFGHFIYADTLANLENEIRNPF